MISICILIIAWFEMGITDDFIYPHHYTHNKIYLICLRKKNSNSKLLYFFFILFISGAEKVLALQGCVAFAEKWFQSSKEVPPTLISFNSFRLGTILKFGIKTANLLINY